jgi:septal ring factor EnvC (AmiA/AmiB activator)
MRGEAVSVEDEVAELRGRVVRLEQEVVQLSSALGAVDRDVSDVQSRHRAILATLHALRETQVDHGRVLEAHTAVLTRLSESVGYLVAREQGREERE